MLGPPYHRVIDAALSDAVGDSVAAYAAAVGSERTEGRFEIEVGEHPVRRRVQVEQHISLTPRALKALGFSTA